MDQGMYEDGSGGIHNVEAEAALIGALLIDNAVADNLDSRLTERDFVEPAHGSIFRAIRDGIAAGVVTPLTLKPLLQHDEDFVALGGLAYLARLTADAQGMFATRELSEQLVELADRRRFRASLLTAAEACLDYSHPVSGAFNEVEDLIAEASASSIDQRTYYLGDAFSAAIDRVGALSRGDIAPGVMVHGLPDWNDITGGMKPGDYILLGGRPSMGKTALSLSVAWRAAMAGHGVLYISREMDITALMPRILADLLFEAGGRATFKDILTGNVGPEDMALLNQIERHVRGWPLVIVDPEEFHAGQISGLIRRHSQAFERNGQTLDLAVIDYLGLIDPPPGKPNREQEVSVISGAIKRAARLNRIPIIVLSQLSRGVEQRDDKRPQLADLRDSGTLEQDADSVIFVYRDEYYLDRTQPDPADAKRSAWEEDMRAARDRIDIYSAKNRQGELMRRKGYFFGGRQAIRNSDYYRTGGGI